MRHALSSVSDRDDTSTDLSLCQNQVQLYSTTYTNQLWLNPRLHLYLNEKVFQSGSLNSRAILSMRQSGRVGSTSDQSSHSRGLLQYLDSVTLW